MVAQIKLDICTYEGKTWLARLTGLGGHYGVERSFMVGRRDTSKSGKTGSATYTVEDGIYEGNEGRRRLGRSWYRVSGDEVTQISEEVALEAVKELQG